MSDFGEDPLEVLRQVRHIITETADAGRVLEVMQEAAIRMLVAHAVRSEQVDHGHNSAALSQAIAEMAEISRRAGAATGDISWTGLKQYFQQTHQGLRT